ncbi:MAG: hypothetical protein AABX07_04970 [Nanoarchaeota archaeon]
MDLNANPNRKEVEAKIARSGDYVKMDYLQACLKKQLDFDTKRFVMLKLATIYESRRIFLEAAKLMRNVADINTTNEGKVNDFAKSMDLFIKSGNYSEAELSLKKAIAVATDTQKVALKLRMKELFKAQAKEYLAKDKRKHAVETYEKMLEIGLNPIERREVQNALLQLYQKLGRVQDYYSLEKT